MPAPCPADLQWRLDRAASRLFLPPERVALARGPQLPGPHPLCKEKAAGRAERLRSRRDRRALVVALTMGPRGQFALIPNEIARIMDCEHNAVTDIIAEARQAGGWKTIPRTGRY